MLLNEITLQTNHIDELCEFYTNVLQLQVNKINAKKIQVKAGTTSLIFESVTNIKNPFYHFAFNIPCNKIEEAFHWLKDKVEFLWIEDYKSYIAEFTSWHARSVYFIDPAGNIVELIARFDLKNDDTASFASSQILNISEIGIVLNSDKFDENVDVLLSKFQLDYFSKQPPLPQFRAVGDDDGLFIIVPGNRNWFPTKITSGIFPLSVKFANDEKHYTLTL